MAPYLPPSGWLEPSQPHDRFSAAIATFHTLRDCPAVADAQGLTATDKPYGALRCRKCAPV